MLCIYIIYATVPHLPSYTISMPCLHIYALSQHSPLHRTAGKGEMESLRSTCVELHGEGQAIRFCALEFALHPNAVHLELPLAVHK
jgi:hypothetical protein